MARRDRASGAQWASARRGYQPEAAGQTSLSHPASLLSEGSKQRLDETQSLFFLQPVLMKIQSRFAYAELTNTSFLYRLAMSFENPARGLT